MTLRIAAPETYCATVQAVLLQAEHTAAMIWQRAS